MSKTYKSNGGYMVMHHVENVDCLVHRTNKKTGKERVLKRTMRSVRVGWPGTDCLVKDSKGQTYHIDNNGTARRHAVKRRK